MVTGNPLRGKRRKRLSRGNGAVTVPRAVAQSVAIPPRSCHLVVPATLREHPDAPTATDGIVDRSRHA
jgi:hypothetical protein